MQAAYCAVGMVRMVSSGLVMLGLAECLAPARRASLGEVSPASRRARSAASAIRLRSAPELVIDRDIAAARQGSARQELHRLDRIFQRRHVTTPAAAGQASNASALPASEPVCASAKARGASEAPIFTATTVLPFGARAARGGEEVRRVGDGFDVAEDDAQFRLNGEVVDEVADRAADLPAAGGEVADLQPEFVDGAVDRRADRAALRGDRDRAFRKLLQGLVGNAAETGFAAARRPCSSARRR